MTIIDKEVSARLLSGVSQVNEEISFLEYLVEIEDDLQQAIVGFDEMDLIKIRQCAARIQANANLAWRAKRKEEQNGRTTERTNPNYLPER